MSIGLDCPACGMPGSYVPISATEEGCCVPLCSEHRGYGTNMLGAFSGALAELWRMAYHNWKIHVHFVNIGHPPGPCVGCPTSYWSRP